VNYLLNSSGTSCKVIIITDSLIHHKTNCINKTNRHGSTTKKKNTEESGCGILKAHLQISLEILMKILKNLGQYSLHPG
jgi:hypothetical protein